MFFSVAFIVNKNDYYHASLVCDDVTQSK